MENELLTGQTKITEEMMTSILAKEPFFRGYDLLSNPLSSSLVGAGERVRATAPRIRKVAVSQEQFLAEYDEASHDVLNDANVPSIVAKVSDGSYIEIKDKKVAFPYQKRIVEKQTLYLCNKPVKMTLCEVNPTSEQEADFAMIETEWANRNMEYYKTELIKAAKIAGDAALLHYVRDGKYGVKVLRFEDGYNTIPIFDETDHVVGGAVLYEDESSNTVIDVYSDTSFFRLIEEDNEWQLEKPPVAHGFPYCPLTYCRTDVAWNNVQSMIEVKEIIHNIFSVIMKRHGWGMLYIKGNPEKKMKVQAGSVILTDNSDSPNADAKFLQAPSPDGMMDFLKGLHTDIQMMSGTVFLDPSEVSISGDTSGLAIKMLLNNAYERALTDARALDPVLDDMLKKFIYGIGLELNKVTALSKLKVRAEYDVWIPQSDSEVATNLNILAQAGALSLKTRTETAPYRKPDEYQRIKAEASTGSSPEEVTEPIVPQPNQSVTEPN